MPHTFSSRQVVCRPALPRDHADITQFCQRIWDGGDYVPEVWRDWFKDPNGIFVTAEYMGHAIGCAKLSLIDDGQWWLEGVRVDPKYQGLKVGSKLHNYLTEWWLEHGDGAARLITENPAMIHLCEKTGYVKVQELRGYRAKPIDEPTNNFSPVNDIHQATTFAIQSETLQLTGNFIDLGWHVGTPNAHIFEKFANPQADYFHAFYWWKNKQGLFSAWEDEEADKRQLFLGVLTCAVNDLPFMLMDIRRFAARKKFDRVFLLAFLNPHMIAGLEQAGFSTSWENCLRLFERNSSS